MKRRPNILLGMGMVGLMAAAKESLAAEEEADDGIRVISHDPSLDTLDLKTFKEIKDPLNEPWRRNRKGMLKRSRK